MKWFVVLFFIVSSAYASDELYPFDNKRQEVQFQALLKELRCLVCQNQDLADSNAELAKDLRQEVYQQIRAGHSDSEITQFLSARYGDFILFNPPLKFVTLLLWFGPCLFLTIGFFIYWRSCRRRPDE